MAFVRPGDWQRILAVRLDNAGDVVMLGPALRALATAAPAATITLLASPAGALAAPLLPEIGRTIVTRAPWQDLSGGRTGDRGRVAGLVRELEDSAFDAAFIFTSFSQSAWPPAFAAFLAGIPIRVGSAADFGGALLTHVIPPLAGLHQVDRNARLIEGVGIPVPDRRLAVRIRAADREAAGLALLERGVGDRPYLVVAPGASAVARRMPADRLAPAVGRIAREHGLAVVVTGGGGEADRDDADHLARATGGVSLAGATDLPTLAATIARASLVVTAHSLPLHLADATARPMVVAFSGTDREAEWGPRSAPAVLLRTPTPCAPCRRFDCPWGLPCLDIPADSIVEAARRVLGAPARTAEPTPEPTAALPRHDERKEPAWTATRS